MKVRQVVLARAIRQVAAAGTGAPRVDLIQKIKEKYQFLKFPQTYEEVFPDPQQGQVQGILFHGGKFKIGTREVGIAMLQFLPGMIVCDTQTTTDDADFILDDYIEAANKDHPEAIIAIGAPYYLSQIEFSLERVPQLLAEYEEAGKAIDRCLAEYGTTVPKFSFWSTGLNTELHGLGVMPPAFFAIERRVGFPQSAKMFFSQSPLRTKDHIGLLEKLDATLH